MLSALSARPGIRAAGYGNRGRYRQGRRREFML